MSNAPTQHVGIAPAAGFAGSVKTATTSGDFLVAVSTPCRWVWLGPRVDSSGNPQNTKPVFVGDGSNQNIPVMPSNFEGVVLEVDDAAKVKIKPGVNGEGVQYRIFR